MPVIIRLRLLIMRYTSKTHNTDWYVTVTLKYKQVD